MAWLSKSSRRGTMLVEAAIVLPVILLITLGLLEYGWIFIKTQEINNAARHGARVGARVDADEADIQSTINTLMSRAGINGYTVTVTTGNIDDANEELGQKLVVTIQVPYNGTDLELVDVPLIPVPANLGSSVTMVKETS